jgi:hypothetical protein
MAIKKIKKRVFGSNMFRVKEDPNEWTEKDIDHLARVLIRVSKKSPIKMITYNGVGTRRKLRKGAKRDNRPSHQTWGSKYTDGPQGQYMDFEVEFEYKCSKATRKTNIEDIKMLLLMELI